MNNLILSGRLAKDAEVKQSKAGKDFLIVTIATDGVPNEKGEKVTSFHRAICFGKLAQQNKNLKKGASVFAEGQLSYSSYEKNGQTIYSTNIILNTLIGQVMDTAPSEPPAMGPVHEEDVPF